MAHQERTHALLSPSSAERWLNCNVSARLCEDLEDKASSHAALGTQAHELAEFKLRTALGETPTEPQLKDRDEAMDNYSEDYAQYCVEEFERLGSTENAVISIEERVKYEEYVPEGSGMADCIIIGNGEMTVIDFKYGEGILVDADDNPQLKLYALGALQIYDCVYEIDKINLCIYQPRRSNVSKWSLAKMELLNWAENIVKPAALLAFEGKGTQEPGDWCRWCKINGTCRVRAERNVEILRYKMRNPTQLELWEIADIIAISAQVEKWLSDVGKYALTQAQNGEELPGMKLVEGRAQRTITRARFPEMQHLGDITKIDGGKIEPCDIVTFGSPCQGVSIAGKHKGIIKDHRSNLFFEATRIISEMMAATNFMFPKYFIFENVPGMLSSNKGEDFKVVINTLSELGFMLDPNILDSQDFGVAQRRKRIFIVGVNMAYFDRTLQTTDPINRDNAVLKKMSKNGVFAECCGFTTKHHAHEKVKLSEILENEFDVKHIVSPKACLGILRRAENNKKTIPEVLRRALLNQAAEDGDKPIAFEPGAFQRLGGHWSEEICPTLRAATGDNQPCVAIPIPIETHAPDSRYKIIEDDVAQTLSASMGTGGGNVPLVLEPIAMETKTPCCSTNICPTLKARDYKDPTCVCVPIALDMHNHCAFNISPTLRANDYKDPTKVLDFIANWGWIVRRLTPTECLTLQGLPKTWCNGIADPEPTTETLTFWLGVFQTLGKKKTLKQIRTWLKKPYSDSKCYEMCGNGCTTNVVEWILKNILEYDQKIRLKNRQSVSR